jgi:hypothetical protein
MSPHEEFPALTPQAERALREADRHLDLSQPGWHRRYLAAFLQEAMKQSTANNGVFVDNSLRVIANNLWSPPPSPPTLTRAREAARQLGGKNGAIVRACLETLGGG